MVYLMAFLPEVYNVLTLLPNNDTTLELHGDNKAVP